MEDWQDEGSKPSTRLRTLVGPLASGAAVVADDVVVAGILEHKRTLIGLDMEAYGVARAVHEGGRKQTNATIVKAVTDFGNLNKDDKYRWFASYASARFAIEFLRTYWGLLRSIRFT